MKAGDIIGRKYRLTQRLGAGGMGAVWEAVHERTGRMLALKLILNPTDDLRQRMLREARACGSLMHPNIVELYDVGETATGDPFLVMELLFGETLADLLSRMRRLDPSLATRIGRDIACALAAAHAASIIHRDLKPANIFMHRRPGAPEHDFIVKVLDFGVSKNLASNEGPATVTGMIVGSPAYMSPEQLRMAKDVDHRTDIWAVGVLLFEMLTGVRPFQGTFDQVVRQILQAPVPPASSLVRQVGPELDAIIAQCLARDWDHRIQSAAHLASVLAPHAQQKSAGPELLSAPAPPPSAMGSPPADAQPTLGKVPALGPTLPYPKQRATAGPNESQQAVPAEQPQPEASTGAPASGTQLLSATDPIASPTPAWRLEMQQVLAANRRQSSPALEADNSADLPHGGTVVLSPQGVKQASTAAIGEIDPTSSTAAMVRRAPAPEPLVASPSPGSAGARHRKAWIFAGTATGVTAAAMLMWFAWFELASSAGAGADAGRSGLDKPIEEASAPTRRVRPAAPAPASSAPEPASFSPEPGPSAPAGVSSAPDPASSAPAPMSSTAAPPAVLPKADARAFQRPSPAPKATAGPLGGYLFDSKNPYKK